FDAIAGLCPGLVAYRDYARSQGNGTMARLLGRRPTLTRRATIGAALTSVMLAKGIAKQFLLAKDGVQLASDYHNNTGQDSIAPAEQLIDQALDADPRSSMAWYGRGFVARAYGEHGASLDAFRTAARLGGDYKAQGQIGMALINLGRLQEASE